jgi:hypothetical protein
VVSGSEASFNLKGLHGREATLKNTFERGDAANRRRLAGKPHTGARRQLAIMVASPELTQPAPPYRTSWWAGPLANGNRSGDIGQNDVSHATT